VCCDAKYLAERDFQETGWNRAVAFVTSSTEQKKIQTVRPTPSTRGEMHTTKDVYVLFSSLTELLKVFLKRSFGGP
jgi:hypothetical protein